MIKYRRLTQQDRYQIEAWLRSGLSLRGIARHLKRTPSTICREVWRGQKFGVYEARVAHGESQRRLCMPRPERRRLRGAFERRIIAQLQKDWSPEQIAAVNFNRVSVSTIYRYVERPENLSLKRHFRILRRQQKDRKKPQYYKRGFSIKNRLMIDERPAEVLLRKRIGDYERDTVLGVRSGRMILSIVDRTSRLTKLALIEEKSAALVDQATRRCLRNEPVLTITNDNGPEFAYHERTSRALRAKIYFARAHRAWERGTNENTNGLLRQYFPRKKPIPYLTPAQLKSIENRLNTRPRKCLGFKTPLQVHRELKRRQVLH